MVAHGGLLNHLEPNTNLGTNECSHIELDENWDETFAQNKYSLLIIRLKLHAQ
jgi:hypothetical protein